MSDISEFETRITAAMERIGRAVALAEERAAQTADTAQTGSGIAPAELEAEVGELREALESERETKAELEERVKLIHEKQTSHVAALEAEVEGLRRQLYDLETAAGGLRHANDGLRTNNAALRDAAIAGGVSAEALDLGMQAELDGLSAARATDRAELDGLIADLQAVLPAQEAPADAGGAVDLDTPLEAPLEETPLDVSLDDDGAALVAPMMGEVDTAALEEVVTPAEDV